MRVATIQGIQVSSVVLPERSWVALARRSIVHIDPKDAGTSHRQWCDMTQQAIGAMRLASECLRLVERGTGPDLSEVRRLADELSKAIAKVQGG